MMSAADRTPPPGHEPDLLAGTVFEHANNAVYLMDPGRGSIVAANPAGCRLLGYTHAELLRTPISHIHPSELPELSELLDRVLRNGRASTIRLTCRTKQGSFLPTEITLHAIRTRGRLRVLGLVLDRSESRKPASGD